MLHVNVVVKGQSLESSQGQKEENLWEAGLLSGAQSFGFLVLFVLDCCVFSAFCLLPASLGGSYRWL